MKGRKRKRAHRFLLAQLQASLDQTGSKPLVAPAEKKPRRATRASRMLLEHVGLAIRISQDFCSDDGTNQNRDWNPNPNLK